MSIKYNIHTIKTCRAQALNAAMYTFWTKLP